VAKLKTLQEPTWHPTKNPTFWYHKAIAPSFYIQEDEIA
jgi:hypothetical protein